jgi:hypothetical protein
MDGSAGSLNIYQRLHAVMGEIDYIQKDKKQGMRYSIVSHDKVTAAVRPLLHKHGVIYYIDDLEYQQDGNRTQCKITVTFVNIDDPDDQVLAESFGYGVDDQDKGPGKAMSYAVKYALLKTLGLETGDEPDEVQDERANYKPNGGGVDTSDLGISPNYFRKEEGEMSAARSTKQWKILEPAMSATKTPADLNKWWATNEPQIKEMANGHIWLFFGEVIKHGAEKCQRKLELDLFWSFHEPRLKKLEKINRVNHDSLVEILTKRAEKLLERELETVNAG